MEPSSVARLVLGVAMNSSTLEGTEGLTTARWAHRDLHDRKQINVDDVEFFNSVGFTLRHHELMIRCSRGRGRAANSVPNCRGAGRVDDEALRPPESFCKTAAHDDVRGPPAVKRRHAHGSMGSRWAAPG